MKRPLSKISVVVVAAACAAFAFSASATAQRYRTPRERGYTRDEVNAVIRRVETRAES